MIATILTLAPLGFALALMAMTAVLALAIAGTRALFAAIMMGAVLVVLAAVTALALGAPIAATAFAGAGGVGVVALLSLMLLTTRAAKARARPPAILGPLGGALILGLVVFFGRDLVSAPRLAQSADDGALALWIAALVIAAGLGAFALTAFGERGAEREP